MQMEYIFCWTESDKDEREPPESLQGQGGCLIRQLQTEPNIPTYNTQGMTYAQSYCITGHGILNSTELLH